MFCPSCGFPYGPDDRFCGRCGAALPARAEAAPTSPPPEVPAPSRPKRRLPRFVLPAVLVLAAAGALAFFLTRPPALDPSFAPDSQASFFSLARESPAQTELWRGTERVAILPAEDGFLSAVSSLDGARLLIVDGEGVLHLAGSEGCTTLAQGVDSCALSGDGSTAAWITTDGQLWLRQGEEDPVLVDEDAVSGSVLLSYGGHALVWQSAADGCYRLSLDGGAFQDLPSEGAVPALLTDGGTLYYTVHSGGSLSLYAWQDGTPALLTDRLSPEGAVLTFNRDGTELLCTTEEEDGPVTWFCREGKALQNIGAFSFRFLCSPSSSAGSSTSTGHLSVCLYNVDTLRQKCLRTDQNVWLLSGEGEASPLFPDGSNIAGAYVSQDGTSLVVQTTGASEKNTLYRFDDLWGTPKSRVLDQRHALSLLSASPDLSLLLYTGFDADLVRTYYTLKTGGEPVILTQGNEFAVVTMDNTVLCSTGNCTGLLFSDGGAPVPVEVPAAEDGSAFITVTGINSPTCITVYTAADLTTSFPSSVDIYAVSPDGALSLLSADVLFLYMYAY